MNLAIKMKQNCLRSAVIQLIGNFKEKMMQINDTYI